MALVLLLLGAIGHMVLWVALINRAHALGIARRWVNFITLVCLGALVFIPPFVLWAVAGERLNLRTSTAASIAAWIYVNACAVAAVTSAIQRLYWWAHRERRTALLSNRTMRVRLPGPSDSFACGAIPTQLCRLPGNQALKICTQEKDVAIPRLAEAHDGLRILHLTDLHYSGRIARAFFERVVDEANAAKPDLIAVTGDIVEGDRFIDWIPDTSGRLQAPHGVYYVLGNHDRRATESKVRAALAEAGLTRASGECREIVVNGAPLIVAGNELPWYQPASDFSGCPNAEAEDRPARLLLAHSPDQFGWAQLNDVDLMLAGHLHGGQVRLPVLGAITSPSAHGVRYVCGVFARGNTVMHVSRGVGSLTPLRFGCPPEIAVLVLRPKTPL